MYKPFKLKRAVNKEFYITIVSENGRSLHKSETYKRKRACYANIKAVARLFFSALPPGKIINYVEDTTLKQKS